MALIAVVADAVGASGAIRGGWKLKGGWVPGVAGDRAQTLNNVTLVNTFRQNNDGPGWTKNRTAAPDLYRPIPFKDLATAVLYAMFLEPNMSIYEGVSDA